jgi:hypothetical protein
VTTIKTGHQTKRIWTAHHLRDLEILFMGLLMSIRNVVIVVAVVFVVVDGDGVVVVNAVEY